MNYYYIFIFIFLLALSWFFSSTELAIMSIPNHKIQSYIKQWKFWSRTLYHLKQNTDKLLVLILIWNNTVNTLIAAIATKLSIDIAKSSWIEESLAVWIATWVITFVILMFWEVIPKSFATKNASFIALKSAHIYKFLIFVLYPLVVVIEFIVRLFTWSPKKQKITDEEIETFIDMWKDSWTLDKEEHEKIKKLLDFNETKIWEVMVPRVEMWVLSWEVTVKEAFDYYLENWYSRMPIYNWSIDNIDYFITVLDIVKAYEKWLLKTKIKNLETIRQVIKVPLNQPLDAVLKIFQNSYKHIAIVMDEYGWVSWLVTLEDIIEEIFWEIRDENDRWETDEIRKVWNSTYLVNPNVTIDDLLDEFNISFDTIWLDEKEFSWDTISYVITNKLERFPKLWEVVKFNIKTSTVDKKNVKKEYLQFKINQIKNNKMLEVEISRV